MCRWWRIFSPPRSRNSNSFRARRKARASSSAPTPRWRSAAGLTQEQIVRIYGFEAGGNGEYDVQAGLEYNKRARAITTALGYNQLLATNTVEIVAEKRQSFRQESARRAAAHCRTPRSAALERKIAILRKMIELCHAAFPTTGTSIRRWRARQRGSAFTRLNLDVDIGPLPANAEADGLGRVRAPQGLSGTLTAAELEMMNLTGDGNGFDMITMPRGLARQGADRKFLSAQRLPRQSGRAAQQRRRQADRGDRRAHGRRGQKVGRKGAGRGVALNAAASQTESEPLIRYFDRYLCRAGRRDH